VHFYKREFACSLEPVRIVGKKTRVAEVDGIWNHRGKKRGQRNNVKKEGNFRERCVYGLSQPVATGMHRALLLWGQSGKSADGVA